MSLTKPIASVGRVGAVSLGCLSLWNRNPSNPQVTKGLKDYPYPGRYEGRRNRSHTITLGESLWELPPLILHPFNERVPPSALLENSRAALICRVYPNDGTDADDLKRRLLDGRYSERRMLFFLGKDVFRWIGQCLEWSASTHD